MSADRDMIAAHNLLMQAYGTDDPEEVLTRNIRWFAKAHVIINQNDPKPTAAYLRRLADTIDPLDADAAEAMLDGVLRKA